MTNLTIGPAPAGVDSDQTATLSGSTNVETDDLSGWSGTRYRVGRRLGKGAHGVVYEAFDAEHHSVRVAIKFLLSVSGHRLYRLKNEFRLLAEVRHDNLVGLHGLHNEDGRWFVVMELVEGRDFVRFVEEDIAHGRFDSLRSAIAQVAHGLSAIHAAGKLHRDLKPNNVLVTPEGRVVIVDFGLVSEQEPGGLGRTRDGWFEGTLAYAAPEQLASDDFGSAVDLYALGAMLYEALTGELPTGHEGRSLVPRSDPIAGDLRAQLGAAPDDLASLCVALLAPNPSLRPDASEVARRLGHVTEVATPAFKPQFFGRDEVLASLHDALRASRKDETVFVRLDGTSGIGKSALLANFAESARRRGAVVLRGRSFARETLPFCAFDALVDNLGAYLARLGDADAASLMPREIALLARIFPTLQRVRAIERMPVRDEWLSVHGGARVRAFAALRELLARIADRSMLVLIFDDVQWADADSAALLEHLLSGAPAPSCLFVCACRSEDSERTPMMLRHVIDARPGIRRVDITLGPLDATASRELVHSLLGEATDDLALRIDAESHGSPYLIHEIARRAHVSSGPLLNELLSSRVEGLQPAAQRLLCALCLSTQPLPTRALLRAADAQVDDASVLLTTSLARALRVDGDDCLEIFHARFREEFARTLEETAQQHTHARLFSALEDIPGCDPELLMKHALLAAEPDRAVPYAERAAHNARRQFAFAREAELTEFLRSQSSDPSYRRARLLELAQATSNSGNLAAAASLFEQLAAEVPDAVERRRHAREAMRLYFASGQPSQGLSTLHALCRELGIAAAPSSPFLARIALWWLVLRYLVGKPLASFGPSRTAPPHDPDARERLEVLLGAARSLVSYSESLGAHYMVLAMIHVRNADPAVYSTLARAWDAGLRSSRHGVASPDDDTAIARALRVLKAGDDAELQADTLMVAGGHYLYTARPAIADEHFESATQVILAQRRTIVPLIHLLRSARFACWYMRGDILSLARAAEQWLAESRDRNDALCTLTVEVMGSPRYLANDDVESARRGLALLDTELGRRSAFAADEWWACDVELYGAEPLRALAACRATKAAKSRTLIRHAAAHRVTSDFALARAAIACAAASRERAHTTTAQRAAGRLSRNGCAYARPLAAQIHAALAHLRGDRAKAQRDLELAIEGFEDLGQVVHAASCRRQLGSLLGGDEGHALVKAADTVLHAQGIVRPERWAAMMAPGF